MLTSPVMNDALSSVMRVASAESDPAAALLRAADLLISRAMRHRRVLLSDGLPDEMSLSLDARLTAGDSRMFTRARAMLATMPALASAFERGSVSWGQVRAICSALRPLSVAQRAGVDALVSRRAARLLHADPDELVREVDDEVARLRADLALAREDHSQGCGFLAIQGRLDGRATLFGEGDAESVAAIVEALDSVAAPPVRPDHQGAPTRAAQRFEALTHICESTLAGAGGAQARTRPRPRILVTTELSDLIAAAEGHGSRLLWALAGRPARLTPLSTEVLHCDAETISVIFDHGQPVVIGDGIRISEKIRRALIARDQGCRFPGCHAPAAWTDAHHIQHRVRGGPTELVNLVLLCRRCHRRVHRHRWTISMRDDGSIAFTWRGRAFVSPPRAGPHHRE